MSDIDLLAPMTEAAHAAGDFLRAAPVPAPAATWAEFAHNFEALDKPAADRLRARLSGLRPGAAWGEELGDTLPAHGEVWVVDAVDGAVQLLQDLPYWSVSITLVRDLRPVATVLHSPVRGETYTAARGHGARLNGRLIEPSRKTELELALLATSQPPTVADQPDAVHAAGRSLSALLPHAGAVRNLGPTSWQVADAAGGRIDAFWEYGLDDVNLLGGSLVATEAGLRVTDIEGNPWQAGAASFITAPAALHDQLLKLLS
ncbi:inositol monophosphatase family protein [Streptomyces shenzhenensis]|uniref:inositol monophosphatase family protein n=1 Tax=Streptomyces shenzhenensis TaxID=943815 RepID=UPI001F3ADFA2|nr:inositol monophosphatase [Streptomyces shenzhenensis]